MPRPRVRRRRLSEQVAVVLAICGSVAGAPAADSPPADRVLARLTKLEALYLNGTTVTGAGLRALAGLKGLRTLDLAATRFTDAGLAAMPILPGLEDLNLGSNTGVTDRGMARVAEFRGLKALD